MGTEWLIDIKNKLPWSKDPVLKFPLYHESLEAVARGELELSIPSQLRFTAKWANPNQGFKDSSIDIFNCFMQLGPNLENCS